MTINVAEARAAVHAEKPHENRLSTSRIESRSEDDGTFVVEGYASVTGAPYEVQDWLGEYDETVARGAFTKTLAERDDVRWLVNHDGIALARTASGTLDLKEITKPEDDPQGRNQTGLWTCARLDGRSPLAQTARSAIERGDMSQMSFAFQATRQEWNDDFTQRTIIEARLFDVSAVTYPANPATTVEVVAARAAAPTPEARDKEEADPAPDAEVDVATADLFDAEAKAVEEAEMTRRLRFIAWSQAITNRP